MALSPNFAVAVEPVTIKVFALTVFATPLGAILPVTLPLRLPINAPALNVSPFTVHSPSPSSQRKKTFPSFPLLIKMPALAVAAWLLAKSLFNTISLSLEYYFSISIWLKFRSYKDTSSCN